MNWDGCPSWMVIIIVSREFIISGFRLIAAEQGIVIAASYWGKFKTTFQMISSHLNRSWIFRSCRS
ncbi:MAG: CDP-alcohol phosphatidyltransferase family protein [Clostridium sp.]